MSNIDIDLLLYELIKKYNIYQCIPEAELYYVDQYRWKVINERIEQIPDEKVVAIRGGGVHTQKLWKNLSKTNQNKIKYIIDKQAEAGIGEVETIHPLSISACHVEVIIVSSWKFKEELLMELMDDTDESIEIIDLYDCCAVNGIYYMHDMFEGDKCDNLHKTYLDVNNALWLYKRENLVSSKKFYLEKIIALCIEIRDFLNAQKYIDEYICNGWDKKNNYYNFSKEMLQLWDDIKEAVAKREQEDIILNWVDNINAKEFYSTEFAKKRKEDSRILNNAYTVTPWTHYTLCTVLLSKLAIDDKLYLENRINENNSEILRVLKEADYDFCYIANPGMYQNMFDKANTPDYPAAFKKVILGDRCVSECSTRLQWTSLKLRLQSQKKVCHLIHNMSEVHVPFIYTGISTMRGERKEFASEGMKFVLEQIDWYEMFYGANTYQVYFSDHGFGDIYKRPYEKGRTNIPVIVKGPSISPGEENRLYSHKNFVAIVKYILSGQKDDWHKCFDDYILYQNLDIQSRGYAIVSVVKWLSNKIRPHELGGYQIRGVRTTEDMYVCYATGKELYYRLPDEETNLIEDEKWNARIAELKALCGNNFIDISKEPTFEHSHLIYDYLKMLPEDAIHW